MVEVTLSQLSPRVLKQQAHQWGIYWKIKEEVIYIIGIYWRTFSTDDFILKVHQLGIYLKIKKGGIFNLFSFVKQVWAYWNIEELKDILHCFPSHTCALFLFHQRIIVGGRNKLFSGAQADQQTPQYFYSLHFFIKSNH